MHNLTKHIKKETEKNQHQQDQKQNNCGNKRKNYKGIPVTSQLIKKPQNLVPMKNIIKPTVQMKGKSMLRRKVKSKLKLLSPEQFTMQSKAVCQKFLSLDIYHNSKDICIYLSMKSECNTNPILQQIFKDKKRCFVPRIPDNERMLMLEAYSMDDISSFPKNKWGIPEPNEDDVDGNNRAEASDKDGRLDIIIIPGVAFDLTGRRLGHGKGYYDRYITNLKDTRYATDQQSAFPSLVALALTPQIVDQVPTEEHDQLMTHVLFP